MCGVVEQGQGKSTRNAGWGASTVLLYDKKNYPNAKIVLQVKTGWNMTPGMKRILSPFTVSVEMA